MTVGIVVVILIVAAAVIVIVARRATDGSQPTPSAPAAPPSPGDDLASFHLEPSDFTVDGDTAVVTFDVDVPDEGVGPVLADLLVKQAIEAVRDREARGLPIEGVNSVRVLCRQGDEVIEAATAELGEPGTEVITDEPEHPVHEADEVEFDPLHRLVDSVGGESGATVLSRSDDLASLGAELSFTEGLRSALASKGVSMETMTATDLTTTLLGVAGYQLQPGSSAGTYVATRAGTATYIALVDHKPGGYPELSEQAINSFLAGFYASQAERGLLFSDKFGPHLVYEKERRDDRVRFITRERLQAFVDSIAAL